MRTRASHWIARALEDEGARFAFGIPGTHNFELYDALEKSKARPVLVCSEQGGAFMADGYARSSGRPGVLNLVPGAGLSHALSGIAEAYMDCVPMVVLCCGIRSDTGHAFQLHAVDQLAMAAPVLKAAFKAASPGEVYPLLRKAFHVARSGCPGPVAVEVPANFYLLTDESDSDEAAWTPPENGISAPRLEAVDRAVELLNSAERPAIYAGFGCAGAADALKRLAEKLGAPVATTIQGKGVFPEDHPLWLWNGFGAIAPGFAREIMEEADCLLAIGCRFSEVATGSYGIEPPAKLIHVDVDRDVFDRNFKAELCIAADARAFLEALLPRVAERPKNEELREAIRAGHAEIAEERAAEKSARVGPGAFFSALQKAAGPEAVYAADSGNGTFLAMEHLRLSAPRRFLAPIDYSSMGYGVPAAIGAKLAFPEKTVVAVEGDGAFLMTGLELLTAGAQKAPIIVCLLRDGELGQIVQFQRTTLNRDTCGVLPPYQAKDFAATTGCDFLSLERSADCAGVLEEAVKKAKGGRSVLVEVAIDYSRKTYFTKGVVATNFWRLPAGDKLRSLGRAVGRRLGG